jgi:hypothetical protein
MDLFWGVLKAISYYLILNLYLTPSTFANEVWRNSALDTWIIAGYSNPSIVSLDGYIYASSDEEQYTHGLELDVVVLRGSGWNNDTIKKRVKHLADIYKQCGLKFKNVKLIEIDPLVDGRLDFFPWYRKNGNNQGERARSTDSLARSYPNSGKRFSITYIRSFTDGATGSSGPVWYYGLDNPMLYKQFISLITNSDYFIKKRPSGYSIEAHEVGHALFECAHVGKDNIMALTSSKRIPKIREDHCEIALEHELVRGL